MGRGHCRVPTAGLRVAWRVLERLAVGPPTAFRLGEAPRLQASRREEGEPSLFSLPLV